ncbi:hypothetical protein Tco_0216233 [Tanacetum coccineum]
MANLKFADTHNMVPFLSKPEESNGFEQIVDFLNAHPIKFALTVNPTIYISCIKQFWSTVKAKTINGEVQLHALEDGKKVVVPGAKKPWRILLLKLGLRMYLNIPMIHCSQEVTHFKVMRIDLNYEIDEQSTQFTNQVFLIWKKTNTTQQNEIASLKRRVKKLEKKSRSRTHKLKRLYKVGLIARVESFRDEEYLGEDASKKGRRINAIDADEEITLVSVQNDAEKEMFDVDALNGKEVFVAGKNENVVEEVVDDAQDSTAATNQSHDKGKGIMIKEPMKPMKKKNQISFDEEVSIKLQAKFDEEERLAREKAGKEKEANITLIKEWDEIQAKIDVDYQLAERLQAQEQEDLSDAEKATLFQQLLEKRRKHFAAKRA